VIQRLLTAVIVGSTAAIFVADCLTPTGMVLGVLYGGPVYVSGWLPGRRQTLITAGVATALTLLSPFISPVHGPASLTVVNRMLAIASIWVSAMLTLMHQRAKVVILTQRRQLEHANATLEQRVIERTEELRRTTAEKERIASELRIASQIQGSILPRTFPPFPERPEFEIYAETIPAREMGGDFYDFFLIDGERLGFVIADVSGKGVPAAIFMAVTRSLLKATALRAVEPAECLRHVNSLLCPDNASVMFTTVFYGILHTGTGELAYSSAGHQLPYVLRGAGGVEQMAATRGMGLGVVEDTRFETKKAVLGRGDRLLLYTDGISEAMDDRERMFSERRLREFLARVGDCSPFDLIRALVAEVRRFTGDTPQSDDITLLALRFSGS
jgi:sigma-B regulation protein RsbU (phosphoserine phosphatase)